MSRWLRILAVNVTILSMVGLLWVPPMTQPLPDVCQAPKGTAPLGSPALLATTSLMERVMRQASRDVQALLRLLAAAGAALAGPGALAGGEPLAAGVPGAGALWLQSTLSKVFKGAAQLLATGASHPSS